MSAREKAVEVLADCEHASWARWHKYVGECADGLPNGPWTLAFYHVNHWNRQANTDYADLSEQEKESDRKEVQLALDAIREANLIILDRETVAAAVAVAKSFTPRWTEYECFTQMQDALGGDE